MQAMIITNGTNKPLPNLDNILPQNNNAQMGAIKNQQGGDPFVAYGPTADGGMAMLFKGDMSNINQNQAGNMNGMKPAQPDLQQPNQKPEMKEMIGMLLKLINLIGNLLGKTGDQGQLPGEPNGANPGDPNGAIPGAPNGANPGEIAGGEKGGWLVGHGDYKKNVDGSFNIEKGDWAGHTATPTDTKGSYNITNTLNGNSVGTYQSPGEKEKIASPLTFDLNGNGQVDTTGKDKKFDINGDGAIDNTAWAGAGDGVLAFDSDGNGVSGENGKELFGNNSDINDDGKADGHANGFEALKGAALQTLGADSVADGKLNEQEIKQLEKPVNEGGIGLTMMVDGEKVKPSELGITELDLTYQNAGKNADANGNEHRQVGTGFTRNGEEHAVNDVWFQYN